MERKLYYETITIGRPGAVLASTIAEATPIQIAEAQEAFNYLVKANVPEINEEVLVKHILDKRYKIDNFNPEIKDIKQGSGLWKWFVILALLCIIAETILIRLYKQ